MDKQAATPVELQAAADRLRETQLEIDGLEKRLPTLLSRPEIDAAHARLTDADSALRLAQKQAANSVIAAPIGGELYELGIRVGSYVNIGDLIANIGTLDRMRVRVYVDEPLLGRVKPGQTVTIKWEALPGKQWPGTVDQMPVSIQALGARQVGEVMCIVQNPGRDLIPGVNATPKSAPSIDGAIVIPKEALRREPPATSCSLFPATTSNAAPSNPALDRHPGASLQRLARRRNGCDALRHAAQKRNRVTR